MPSFAALLLLVSPARAGWPEDVSLSSMTEHEGIRQVDSEALGLAYATVVRELGIAIANKPLAPAETLGASGFEFAIHNTLAFNSTRSPDGVEPSPWSRVTPDEDPGAFMFLPTFSARKGLPFSLEVGGNMTWIGMTRTGAFSAYARGSVVEGYKPWPDLTFQLGYSGYVGNPELELGVLDAGVTLGSTFAFGSFPGIRSAQFSPYVNYTLYVISAAPILDAETEEAVGAVQYKGSTPNDAEGTVPALIAHQFTAGFQITNGTFLIRILGSWGPASMPTVTAGLGFSY